MKTIIFIPLFFLSIISITNAQEKSGFLSISIGPSIPIGDYSSKDFDNEYAGWAGPGVMFDISYSHKLGKGNFGIIASLRGQSNPVDAKAIAIEYANLFPGYFWEVNTKGWRLGGIMAGGMGSFPISGKSSFDAKAMIGFLGASSPEINAMVMASNGSGWAKTSRTGAASFAYCLGAGFKFSLPGKMYLVTGVDYLGSKPEFSNVETISSDGSITTDTRSQKVSTINLIVGLAVKI